MDKMLGFTSCPADPDVWMRAAIKSDGGEYYEYVLLYCDDTLVISERGETILRDEIGKYFELKEESIGPPSLYLGGKLALRFLDVRLPASECNTLCVLTIHNWTNSKFMA